MANLAIDFDVLRDAIEEMSFSCDVSDVKLDGQWHRCSVSAKDKQNTDGAYKGWDDGVPCMYCKNWVTGEAKTFHLWQKGRTLSPEEERQYKERIEQAKAEDKKEQKRKWAEAKKKASSLWQRALKIIPADFPYLKKKQLDAAVFNKDEVRFLKACTIKGKDYPDQLVVPVYGEEGLMSLSRIDGDGNKKFLFGGKTEGGHCILAGTQDLSKEISLDEPQVFLIGEGLATVKSACLATGYTGVVVFDCNKMLKGTQLIKKHNPKAKFVILEDDDRKQEATSGNPGVEHAYETAKAVNAYIAHVEAPEGVSMDFNDLYCTAGAEAVKAKIDAALQAESPAATWEMNRLWVEEHKRGNVVFQPKVTADKAAAKATEPAQPEPWGELMPFGGGKIPQFNADYLPPLLADFCCELAEELQVPLELPVAMALPSIATAAQRRYVVRIKGNYTETLNVWTLCPLPPANRKSAVVSACTAPLIEWEGKKGEEVAMKIRMADRLIEVQVGKIADVEKQLRRSEDEAESAALIKKLEELEAGMPEKPVMPQLLVDDITPEALARVLDAQGQCAGMLSAEGGIFDILAGLYSGGNVNMNVFLKSFTGKESYKVNRAGGTFINLSHACLSMGISPQPYVLKKRQAAERFRGLGFDGRFLYFIPKSLLGHRKLEPDEMSPQTMQAYRNKILSLLPPINKEAAQPCGMGEAENTVPDGARRQDIKTSDGRTVLELSEGAYDVWLNYKAKLEPALDEEEGEFKDMTDWAGKTTGTLARIAGLYHIATYDDPAEYPIQKATMEQALYLMTFCSLHAKLAYEMMGEGGDIPCAKEVLKWITKGKSKSFTIVQCRQRFKNATAFKEEGVLERALKELEERNYIRQTAAAPYKGRGARPKETYEVNPAAFEEGK